MTLRDKLTGRLFFQRTGNPFVDLGNVTLVKPNFETGVVEQLTATGGRFQVTHEEPGQVKPRWSLKLDEHCGESLGLLHLATVSGSYIQPVFVSGEETALISDVSFSNITPGAPYYLSISDAGLGDYYVNLYSDAARSVLVSSALVGQLNTFDTPYSITLDEQNSDHINGTLALQTTELAEGEFDETFYTLMPGLRYTSISESHVCGAVKLVLQDQHPISTSSTALAPKYELTFSAELRVTDRGDHTGEKFNEFELSLLATSAVTIDSRQ